MKKRLLPLLILGAALLSGCPDSRKMPKLPPGTPEPKAALHHPAGDISSNAQAAAPAPDLFDSPAAPV